MQPPTITAESTQPAASAEPPKDNPQGQEHSTRDWDWVEASPKMLLAGLLSGVVFGFLLQKGGVAKFDILIGVLLLENFVVVKIMLTAILVGMVGSYFLRRAGKIEQKINETKLFANIFGGLLFGVGFALLAYCPGTNAAAVGEGNYDALTGVVGLLAGSYLYALWSRHKSSRVTEWGKLGKRTVPDLLGIAPGVVVAIATPTFIAILVALEVLGY